MIRNNLIRDTYAQRDGPLFNAADTPVTEPLPRPRAGGVIFATYALLAGKRGTERLEQLVRWCADDFNGVIALDEVHRAKNLWPEKGAKPTATGQAVLALQCRLPHARLLYCSATGASAVRALASMPRLGDVAQPLEHHATPLPSGSALRPCG